MIKNKINFPEPKGIKCNMMPFIQGHPESLPTEYQQYSDIIKNNYLEKGEIGYLTIDESFVEANTSQRGYNSHGLSRNVHIEVGRRHGKNGWGNGWGKSHNTLLDDDVKVLVANSISGTCKVYDTIEQRETVDGDLSMYIEDYPESEGIILNAGEVAEISIFTPHECLPQQESAYRQFFRIVGKGVHGKEPYWTPNPLLN